MGWSRARRPAAERWLGPFDVLHFTDWQVPPQRQGVRSTMIHDLVPLRFPEWVTPRTRSMHGYKYARTRECDLVFVNSEFTGRDVEELLRIPSERIRVAPPGVGAGYGPDGDAHVARSPVRAQPRHAGAAQEPRHARRGVAAAPRRARARARGGGRLGRPAAARRRGDPQARLRPLRGGARAHARRRRLRLPVPVRGLRHPDRRGDGLRRPGRRLVPRVPRRGVRRRRRAGGSGRSPRR